MRVPLFLAGAIVLIVFMIIATAATTGELFGVTWVSWLGASLLSYFVDLLLGGGWGFGGGTWGPRDRHTA